MLSMDFCGTLDPLPASPGNDSFDGVVFDGKWTFATK